MTWPPFFDFDATAKPFRHGVAFGFYAILCLIGFILILLYETPNKAGDY